MVSETLSPKRPRISQTRAQRSFARRAYWRQTRRTGTTYVLLIVLAMLFLAPFIWLVDIALKNGSDLAEFPIQWLPSRWNWENFWSAVNAAPFWQDAQNSLILALLNASLTTITSALVGFGFARLYGPGKKYFFLVMLSTLMLPQIITLIPTYIEFLSLWPDRYLLALGTLGLIWLGLFEFSLSASIFQHPPGVGGSGFT